MGEYGLEVAKLIIGCILCLGSLTSMVLGPYVTYRGTKDQGLTLIVAIFCLILGGVVLALAAGLMGLNTAI